MHVWVQKRMSGGMAGWAEGSPDLEEVKLALEIICDLRRAREDSMEVETANEHMEVETSQSGNRSESAAKRKVDYPAWRTFCQNVKKVTPTCVIDFPYGDEGEGKLNLQGDARLLERMYCFKDGEDRRVVLHVHTLLEWGRRNEKPLKDRASRVTSVNVRHAKKETKVFKQDGGGESLHVLPEQVKLRYKWRDIFKEGKGKSLEWEWQRPKSMPLIEKKEPRVRDSYEEVLVPRFFCFCVESCTAEHKAHGPLV